MAEPRSVRKTWLAAKLAAFVALGLFAAAAGAGGDGAPPVKDLRDARRATLPPPDTDPFLGVVLDEHGGSPRVARVVPGSAAEIAGVVEGDVFARIDGVAVAGAPDLQRVLRAHGPGATLRLSVLRDGRAQEIAAVVGARRRPDDCFHGQRFALAVVPMLFADDAASTVDPIRTNRLLFAGTADVGAGASLADYYRAQSFGRLQVAGRVFEPVSLPAPRERYASQPMGGSPESAFSAAAARLDAREGATMRDFDGVAFLYSGAPETRPGFALWPHRATVAIGGRRVPYYVIGAGDADADTIGVHCHEFGHLLGLPDAYGAGHLTGAGDFCLMAIGHRGGGKTGARSPFSLCPWCRMRLGWLEPVAVDPRVPQRLRLGPVSRGEALLVPMTPRCDDYLLLEVRARVGFDADIPSAGLLVWHVGGRTTAGQGPYGAYVDLVEAHGIDCVDASLVRTDEIAFPTARAKDLTPDTTPPAASAAADAFRTYLTDIEAQRDGSVLVTVGAPRRVTQTPPATYVAPPADDDGYVVRVDPITKRPVKLYVGNSPDGAAALPLPVGGEERR